jgi:hypothetical protein
MRELSSFIGERRLNDLFKKELYRRCLQKYNPLTDCYLHWKNREDNKKILKNI